ncbi:TPA: helix-turn-helix transcriptional regulator [Salmonella enterica subsp. indica]|uniref:Helix-turn-helix transcriptional regulator n=3 Tax=Salmonella enterica TaxID=28901 RepID=A0A753A9S5_SALER|nr:AraC family transcriptional regulator [Salmonella enterica]EBH9040472.1 AraC family transcriptional regulator [Salmonella enterica subsp. indica serovar 11:b:e,n,x]ECI8073248.1 AraC family transcriptional regulator [Salmonella enterica subsp. enterica]EDW1411276.1 helix-turn-helix transcriptional regulator [Salmonella enterica subsp. enterica serovar Farmsen]EEM2504176.1 helix-turn-helix domain-containing protein [Salmonella enterica subsp. indica serovar 45:a:e,n,x]AFK90272.1 transcription
MGKLNQAFLSANARINLTERCSLPYIYFPNAHESGNDCCVDVFYISDGTVELMFNKTETKEVLSGEFILLNRQDDDHFILSGGDDVVVLHTQALPCGLYQDLVLCQGCHEHLQILRRGESELLPVAAEMLELLFRLNSKEDKAPVDLFIEIPIALFFIQLYLIETSCPLFTLHDAGHRLTSLILDIIEKPGYQWRVKDMAIKCNMSTSIFISEFRKISGYTPLSFLKKIRLNRGKKLLENTKTPISVIAGECGYNSHASFAFYIKQEFGMSPIKIRKSHEIKKRNHY